MRTTIFTVRGTSRQDKYIHITYVDSDMKKILTLRFHSSDRPHVPSRKVFFKFRIRANKLVLLKIRKVCTNGTNLPEIDKACPKYFFFQVRLYANNNV